MYSMLLEEISWALEEKEPYNFTHYLILSKTYEEVASKLDEEDDRPQKKKKKATNQAREKFYFHPEDEVFERHTVCHGGFAYTHEQDEGHSDSKRAFQELGIKPQGNLAFIEAGKFEAAVKDVAEYLKPPG
jgi:protein BCP1